MRIHFEHRGSFRKTEKFLKKADRLPESELKAISKIADEGIKILADATPVDTGKTASSWKYSIEQTKNTVRLVYYNTNMADEVSVAILLQYGHGTRDGSFVTGTDYINPAFKTIFEKILDEFRREVNPT